MMIKHTIALLSCFFSSHIFADSCFHTQSKNNIVNCDIDEGFSAGSRVVDLKIKDQSYKIKYESCQNELTETGCSKAEIQINQSAMVKAKSYIRDGSTKNIIPEQQWNSNIYDCAKSSNGKIDICWK